MAAALNYSFGRLSPRRPSCFGPKRAGLTGPGAGRSGSGNAIGALLCIACGCRAIARNDM